MTNMGIDHEVISIVILPLLLIREGYLSVTDKSMCSSTGSQLRGVCLNRNRVSSLTDLAQYDPNDLTGL